MNFPDVLKLDVTQEDIDKAGDHTTAFSCPIAQAIRRTFPGTLGSANHINIIVWENSHIWGKLAISEPDDTARDFMRKFDYKSSYLDVGPVSLGLIKKDKID